MIVEKVCLYGNTVYENSLYFQIKFADQPKLL